MVSETVNDSSGMTASTLLQEINQAKLALSTSKDAQDDKTIKKSDKRPNKKAKNEYVEVDTKAQFEPFMTDQCSLNSTEKLDVFHGVIPVVTNASSEYVTVVNSETSSGVDSLHVTDTSDLLPSGLKIMIDNHQSKLLSKMSDPLLLLSYDGERKVWPEKTVGVFSITMLFDVCKT
jgi:hypothetical protein